MKAHHGSSPRRRREAFTPFPPPAPGKAEASPWTWTTQAMERRPLGGPEPAGGRRPPFVSALQRRSRSGWASLPPAGPPPLGRCACGPSTVAETGQSAAAARNVWSSPCGPRCTRHGIKAIGSTRQERIPMPAASPSQPYRRPKRDPVADIWPPTNLMFALGIAALPTPSS